MTIKNLPFIKRLVFQCTSTTMYISVCRLNLSRSLCYLRNQFSDIYRMSWCNTGALVPLGITASQDLWWGW
jgi:hypothetical protein